MAVELFPPRVAIGQATITGKDGKPMKVPVYATRELLKALAPVGTASNLVNSGFTSGQIANVPAGGITAANVQAALNELDAEKQPVDGLLTALSALVTVADRMIYATGADMVALTTLTAFARTLLDDVDAAAMRTTLGLVVGADVQPWDAELDAWAGKTAPAGVVVGTTDAQTLSSKTLTAPVISGGTVDNAAIGATTPATGKFTTCEATSYLKSASTVVASLPAAGTAGAGARHFVTDATATTFMSIVAGGGANAVPVVSDATNWRIG